MDVPHRVDGSRSELQPAVTVNWPLRIAARADLTAVLKALVFDINGTLLDTQALAPAIRGIFGSRYTVEQWFNQIIVYSMATSLAGDYQDFGDIAISVLAMAADARRIRLDTAQRDRLRSGLKTLPAFPDVSRSLSRLRDAKYRIAALSNSGTASLTTQLQNAGIRDALEQCFSVEQVGRFKPAPEPYRAAARGLGVETREMLMVAAHAWDLLGAVRAGCRTALILRAGKALYPSAPHPDFVATDLADLADQLTGTTASSPRKARGYAIAAAASGALLLGLMARNASQRAAPSTQQLWVP